MKYDKKQIGEHEPFRAKCALAIAGELSREELAELAEHTQKCSECREAYRDYNAVVNHGIPLLAATYGSVREDVVWDDSVARTKLFARVREAQLAALPAPNYQCKVRRPFVSLTLIGAAIAACLALVTITSIYQSKRHADSALKERKSSTNPILDDRLQELASEKEAVDDLISAQNKKLEMLRSESSAKQSEILKLQSQLDDVQQRANNFASANATSVEQIHLLSQERDGLSVQLADLRRSNDSLKDEVIALRANHEKATLQLASLQMQIDQLAATNRDQQSKLESTGRFLSSDRDIRELMGARNLYIADVFDVDSSSRTRKPFGRVFYTKGKSLIFYAFDLDQQPAPRNADSFQAWGQKDAVQGQTPQPISLGILYMDSETSRRWALRCDDPRELAQIDAVFVTIEPPGGSTKPTGKPFLYAMLRKEANHP